VSIKKNLLLVNTSNKLCKKQVVGGLIDRPSLLLLVGLKKRTTTLAMKKGQTLIKGCSEES